MSLDVENALPTIVDEERSVMSAWVDLLKAVPGAATAVTEIVGEIGHATTAFVGIGAAKAKQVAQSIDDQTKMNSEVSAALTHAAVKYVDLHDDALGPRALAFGAQRFVKQQVNREAVVFKTLEYLEQDPLKEIPKEVPTEDWFNVFGKLAENASSEKLREHFAQMLRGEIARPGSFSFACLHMASIIDQKLAATIEAIVPWIVKSEFVPVLGPANEGEIYSNLLVLDAIGFLRLTNSSYKFRYTPEGIILIEFWNTGIKFEGTPNSEVVIAAAVLSPPGRELLSILDRSTAPELVKLISDYVVARGAKNLVNIAIEGKSL